MSYRYDVFLSYRRIKHWSQFVTDRFYPMLYHWLHEELDEEPRIYFDVDDIRTGTSWPHEVAASVASSKVMVCLWSRQYFHSDWCRAEFGHMLARRKATSKPNNPLPLILAATIHDGEDFPKKFSDIQQLSIQEYSSPWIAKDSPKIESLSDMVMKLAGDIRLAIQRVPDYDPTWRDLAIDEFVGLFENRSRQNHPPSLGVDA